MVSLIDCVDHCFIDVEDEQFRTSNSSGPQIFLQLRPRGWDVDWRQLSIGLLEGLEQVEVVDGADDLFVVLLVQATGFFAGFVRLALLGRISL